MFSGIKARLSITLLYACLSLAIVACSKPQTPEEVAASFWHAIASGKPSQVKKHVSAKDHITMESLQNVMPISDVSFGKIIIDGTVASVDTMVTLEGDRPMDLPVATHLVKENERWTVDYERTINTIIAAGKVAAVINQFKDIGTALKEGIGRSVVELEKTLPSIEKELSNMEQQIQQAVPELKSRFENFSRQLEQALAAPLENTDPDSGAPESPPAKPEELDAPQKGESAEADTEQSAMPQLTEELSNIEDEILKAVPQLKEQIHDFVEQLQEALKLPPAEHSEQEAAEPVEQIEI